MGLMKELAELNAIYQKMSTPDVDEAMIVTNADKKGNTPAYQNFKKGMKKKDGTPMYKAADHMKEEEVIDEKMNAGLRAYLDKKKVRREMVIRKRMVMATVMEMVRKMVKVVNQTFLT